MKTSSLIIRILPLVFLGVVIFCYQVLSSATPGYGKNRRGGQPASIETTDYRVSGPYAHQNLSLFLIHGRDKLDCGQKVLTLAEALRLKKVVVQETSDVNQLIIVNVSDDYTIFIMSGDIVKGGKQDRTIKFDLILGPRSGEVPITVHCVESGRWRGRGSESTAAFGSSSKMLATKNAKLSNRARSEHGAGQNAVWESVAEAQDKLSGRLDKDVRKEASASSFQLTLEDEDLTRAIADYQRELVDIIDGQDSVIGYAFAINGEINSADVFGNHELFSSVWPRLLEAVATEAVSEYQPGVGTRSVSLADIKAFLESAERKLGQAQPVTDRIHEVTRESDEVILFETKDMDNGGAEVRRNYIKK